ncbi:replication factor C subunit 3 [Macrosteles quadrilineatus]|uniref:replication factor C subunit 3 n=1 Tax=Macrosteles quadrilineatus TaxID=74068 RepID=UPI0023E21A57|nr:replication factor C subunit 3 [Macrosteles quadrilineatus]
MSLWVDKYRPTSLQKLDYHKTQAAHLKNLVQQGDFPHLLFYGPSGAGKRTRIMALLRELYGPGVERLRMEHLNFQTPSNKKLDVMTLASNYHIQVNPSDAGIYDRIVVMELIKNAAQTHQLDSTGQREFKVILLDEVDRLTKDAQHALRRTMEKYIATCRLILSANSISQVIPAIRSRCLGIRVAAPTQQEIVSILQSVCKKEGLTLPVEFADKIAEKCDRNLRRAILMCEACKVQQYPFTADQKIAEPDWQVYMRDTAKIILQEQSPAKLMTVRTRLYELLVHGIPINIVFKGLLKELLKNCDVELKPQVVELAATYEHQCYRGSKPIFHLEAFVAQFMAVYLKFMEENLGMF